MLNELTTPRLSLSPLTHTDVGFIFELVNTPGWLAFISSGKSRTLEAAAEYVQRIITNPQINYWVIRLKDNSIPVGVITYIQRDHLPHPDFGFALLPHHTGKGYASEASSIFLDRIVEEQKPERILAITNAENVRSVKLLEKLGFIHDKTTVENGEEINVFMLKMIMNKDEKMNNEIFERLANFTIQQAGVANKHLTRATALSNDLGITGDDAVEYLIEYGEHFKVNVSKFMAADYFEGEGADFWGFNRRTKKVLTLGHLEKGIIAGRLDEEVINT